MTVKVTCALALSAICCLGGCSEMVTTIIGTSTDNNLIKNSTFDIDGKPSFRGWTVYAYDSTYVTFSNDVPPSAGAFSARLRNTWGLPGEIDYMILPPRGTHAYRLSAWTKTDSASGGGGIVSIENNAGHVISGGWPYDADTVWTLHVLVDTITTAPTDTLLIILTGNNRQWARGYTLFNLPRFEILN